MADFLSVLQFRENLLFGDQTITRSELESCVDNVAGYLSRGIRSKSPFVYLFTPNHVKTVIAYFAIIRAGLIVVLIDPRVGPIELQEMTEVTPPAALVRIDSQCLKFDYPREISFCQGGQELNVSSDLDDVCTIAYGAAVDGYAKAVMLTRKGLLADAQAWVKRASQVYVPNGGFASCALLPLHSLYGLQCGIFVPMMFNVSILIAELNDVGQIMTSANNIDKYKVRLVSLIPPMCHLLATAPEIKHQLRTVEFIVSGGCRLAPEIFNAFHERFGKPVREGYGLTEASPVCTYSHEYRVGAVGKALDCCEVRIMDDDDREVPRGTVGEICVKGENVMRGYYNNAAATRAALKNGWLHTGDLGQLDSDGYLRISQLKKRMLNVGGRKVYPAEVERLIRLHDNVESIEVFRRASRLCGDGAQAKVKLKKRTPETEEAFRLWCFKNLSSYKIPRPVEFL